MTGSEIVAQIVEILTSGITSFAKAIGSGIADCASAFAFTGTGESQTLSVFMVLVLVFAGISLCMGLTRLVFNWLSSLGAN